jgi:hypothetical protein
MHMFVPLFLLQAQAFKEHLNYRVRDQRAGIANLKHTLPLIGRVGEVLCLSGGNCVLSKCSAITGSSCSCNPYGSSSHYQQYQQSLPTAPS